MGIFINFYYQKRIDLKQEIGLIILKMLANKKSLKISFKGKCNRFFIWENKRLYEIRKINTQFDKKSYIINSLILTEEEEVKIIKLFQKN